MIFGAVIDPNMADEIRITLIATGFERAGMPRRMVERPVTTSPRQQQDMMRPMTPSSRPQQQQDMMRPSVPVSRPQQQQDMMRPTQGIPVERPSEAINVSAVPTPPPPTVNPPEFKPQPSYQEDLDIPTFLRNRR
jgi:cell division protein FtsZ